VRKSAWDVLRGQVTLHYTNTEQVPGRSRRRNDDWKVALVLRWMRDHLLLYGMEGKAQALDEVVTSLAIYVTYMTRSCLMLTFRGWVSDHAGPQIPPEWVTWALSPQSESILSREWIARRKEKGSLLVQPLKFMADKGGLQGCPACTTLQLRYNQASGQAKVDAFNELRRHNKYWVAERAVLHDIIARVMDSHVHANPADRLEGAQHDGYDVRKATLPITTGFNNKVFSRIESKQGPFYKQKISGSIVYDYVFQMVETPPWVASGMNLACTAMQLCWQERARSTTPLGHQLWLNVDGGSENWGRTTFYYYAWLTKLFPKGVHVLRLPVKHTYNDLDRGFQPGACYFHGRAGGSNGRLCMTPSDWDEGMNAAYPPGRRGSKFGGDLHRPQVHAVYDYTEWFLKYGNKAFSGWGHARQYRRDPDTGLFFRGARGSLVHFLHFFVDTAGWVRLRYKFGGSYPESAWLPEGADGVKPVGLLPFTVPLVGLPSGETPPPLAAFDVTWTEAARTKLLGCMEAMHDNAVEHMPLAAIEEWRTVLDAAPLVPGDVRPEMLPVWRVLPFPDPAPVVPVVRPIP
jgi:hypothetical protein